MLYLFIFNGYMPGDAMVKGAKVPNSNHSLEELGWINAAPLGVRERGLWSYGSDFLTRTQPSLWKGPEELSLQLAPVSLASWILGNRSLKIYPSY